MCTRVTYKVFMVFMVVVMLNGTIGCDLGEQSAPVSSDALVLSGSLTKSVEPLPTDPITKTFSVDLEHGHVDIMDKGFLGGGDGLFFELKVAFDDGEMADRILELRTYLTVGGLHGYRATLLDPQGTTLWEMEQQTSYDNDEYLWSSEKTPFDELVIEQFRTDTSITEVYTQNGQTEVFSFPTNDGEIIQSVHREIRSGKTGHTGLALNEGSLSQAVTAELVRFDSFYDANSSLIDNRDGFITVEILTNHGVADWLSLEYSDTDGRQVIARIPDWVCITAARCALVKCGGGGPFNALCDTCVAVVVVCTIERIVEDFF